MNSELTELKLTVESPVRKQAGGNLADDELNAAKNRGRKRATKRRILTKDGVVLTAKQLQAKEDLRVCIRHI